MSALEIMAVVAVVVEVVLMFAAWVDTERRHWKHSEGSGPKPRPGDDVLRVSGWLYAVAMVAVTVAALAMTVELTLPRVGMFALFGVLFPALAANSVVVLVSRGRAREVAAWQWGLASAVAAAGGLLSVALMI
ncbi:hypothetical protein C6N75_15875 [Streptomyces solincola]|uniref:Uncharacterized protein n=1 Tax=Streptomyces solincola TaxID=2100817 RepID=A0A2S9PV32_9ACTN|nr:hypothetical protein [Streptomyces solincola]PRH78265.1 hypothetical protein C6N75_15875 [Streptomyces solincola]